jgi:hypothetical protein
VEWVDGMGMPNIKDEAAAFLTATDGPPTHPCCAECGVPMWLARVDTIGAVQIQHFECKACDAKLTLSSWRTE